MKAQPVSPILLERYELKYLVPIHYVDLISKYVESFCEMDYYSQISSDGFYTINSLYFETPQFYFLRNKANLTNRFSLRVRSYGESPKAPYYFETKQKIGDFSKKRRGKVPIENWQDLFLNFNSVHDLDWSRDVHLQYFLGLVQTYNAHPTILTQYRRRAYFSNIDDYVRVTFDRSLRYAPETNFNASPVGRQMLNYDHPDTFGYSGHNVILELKCERKIPQWLVDMIQRFDLMRMGFSKFESSMLECYSEYGNNNFIRNRIGSYF